MFCEHPLDRKKLYTAHEANIKIGRKDIYLSIVTIFRFMTFNQWCPCHASKMLKSNERNTILHLCLEMIAVLSSALCCFAQQEG